MPCRDFDCYCSGRKNGNSNTLISVFHEQKNGKSKYYDKNISSYIAIMSYSDFKLSVVHDQHLYDDLLEYFPE